MKFDQRSEDLFNWLNSQQQDPIEDFRLISGDASFRRYFRFKYHNSSYIAVDAPVETEDSALFVALAEALAKYVTVPQVVAYNFVQGFMWLSDLGSTHLADRLNEQTVEHLYQQALNELPKLQAVKQTQLGSIPAYDKQQVVLELSIFTEWLISTHLGLQPNQADSQIIQDAFDFLTEQFLSQPTGFTHRDFHSRNLMLVEQKIAIIDFQGALIGPITYDLVSLLKDCYIKWPTELVERLSEQYRIKHHADIDPIQWQKYVDLTGMQRHLKAAGIFARLHHRDGKSHYLADIPRTLSYVQEVALKYPELHKFANWLTNNVINHSALTREEPIQLVEE